MAFGQNGGVPVPMANASPTRGKKQKRAVNATDALRDTGRQNEQEPPPKYMALDLEGLAPKFCMPLNIAADSLGVCPTNLKLQCRRLGIFRWPHRQIVKHQLNLEIMETRLARIENEQISGRKCRGRPCDIEDTKASYHNSIEALRSLRTKGVDTKSAKKVVGPKIDPFEQPSLEPLAYGSERHVPHDGCVRSMSQADDEVDRFIDEGGRFIDEVRPVFDDEVDRFIDEVRPVFDYPAAASGPGEASSSEKNDCELGGLADQGPQVSVLDLGETQILQSFLNDSSMPW